MSCLEAVVVEPTVVAPLVEPTVASKAKTERTKEQKARTLLQTSAESRWNKVLVQILEPHWRVSDESREEKPLQYEQFGRMKFFKASWRRHADAEPDGLKWGHATLDAVIADCGIEGFVPTEDERARLTLHQKRKRED